MHPEAYVQTLPLRKGTLIDVRSYARLQATLSGCLESIYLNKINCVLMQQLYNSSLIDLLNFYLLYSLYILSEILFLKIIFKKFLGGFFAFFF